MSVFVCSKVESLQSKDKVQIDLPEVTANSSVEQLYNLVKTNLNLNETPFELICFGKRLQQDKSLAFYGIRSGAIIYAFKKKQTLESDKIEDPKDRPKQTDTDIRRMAVALRTAIINPDFKSFIDRLREKEFRENLIACTPGLNDDPVAIGVLQDIELLALYTEQENIAKVLENHPSLADAATFLAAAFHEESLSSASSSTPSSAPILPEHNYSLDFSDEEDDEPEPGPSSNNNAQRENIAAMRNLIRGNRNQAAQVRSGAGPSNPSGAVITSQMLTSALQSLNQPAVSVPPPAAVAPSSVAPSPASASAAAPAAMATGRDWTPQILQLREMGLTDDALIRHALEATNGDITAAIDIITGNL